MDKKNDISREIRHELEQLAPTLSKIKKTNPFEVPERYFDTLPAIIQEHCIAQEKKTIWFFPSLLYVRVIAISATVVLIAAMVFLININDTSDGQLSFEQLNTEDVAAVLENDYDIDEDLLVDALVYSASDYELTAKSGEEDEIEEIIEYLIDNNIDLSTIINEL